MKTFTYRFRFEDLKIDPVKISRLIGYDMAVNDDLIADIIEDTLQEAARLCDIRAEFAIFSDTGLDKSAGTLIIGNIVVNLGRLICSQLSGIEEAAVFLCTAGSSIGETAGRLLKEKDFLRGYILDIAGSELAESAADLLQAKLKIIAEERGKSVTNRYSPGYCGWNVSEQHKLFSLMPGNFCGISLTESALMIPVKSVSGIIGIGRDVRFSDYQCNLCDDKNCIYRRLKERTA